ncbi:10303_t:CDS:2, partial [Entrophospora sp. SA101]
ASSESISSAYCILPKQPQVNASKLAYNLENCEDSSQLESCGIEELKSNQHDEVITNLDKNIIVEQELKQQLSSPAHTSRSDQTSEEQDPSLDTTQNIVCMFKKANKLGQEAIYTVKKKTATSMVYQEIKQLLPEITDVNLKCTDGNVDYYGITDNTSCPLCRLDHDDIEGEYKDGTYYIKCEQHIVQIAA